MILGYIPLIGRDKCSIVDLAVSFVIFLVIFLDIYKKRLCIFGGYVLNHDHQHQIKF